MIQVRLVDRPRAIRISLILLERAAVIADTHLRSVKRTRAIRLAVPPTSAEDLITRPRQYRSAYVSIRTHLLATDVSVPLCIMARPNTDMAMARRTTVSQSSQKRAFGAPSQLPTYQSQHEYFTPGQ